MNTDERRTFGIKNASRQYDKFLIRYKRTVADNPKLAEFCRQFASAARSTVLIELMFFITGDLKSLCQTRHQIYGRIVQIYNHFIGCFINSGGILHCLFSH
jgi:hypothetical protein